MPDEKQSLHLGYKNGNEKVSGFLENIIVLELLFLHLNLNFLVKAHDTISILNFIRFFGDIQRMH